MNRSITSRLEIFTSVLLLGWAMVLQGCFFLSAGALWRDEANSLLQAQLPTVKEIWSTLQYDSFPILYPLFLRWWIGFSWIAQDLGIRLSGALVGLIFLSSLWFIPRSQKNRIPMVSILLLSASPLFISEIQSVRPYGIGLLGLLWLFGCMGRYLLSPAAVWLWLGSMASVIAVQSSYANALFVGVLSVAASSTALIRRRRWAAVFVWIPAFGAALSLFPYLNTLRRAGSWVAMVQYRVDWKLFWEGLIRAFSLAFPAVWIAAVVAAVICGTRRRQTKSDPATYESTLALYATIAAALGVAVQLAFIELIKVPPFPRYFLASLLLIACAADLWLQQADIRVRVLTVLCALLLVAWPSWTFLRQRRTNVDQVAAVLSREAAKDDLIVISPWFLHTSFQLYYRGSSCWITIPPLQQGPIMRYDLIMQAMLQPDPGSGIARALHAALDRNAAVWFVSQVNAKDALVSAAPQAPGVPQNPDGHDYVRFRSFWEREIHYRLKECCSHEEWPLPEAGPLWNEEHLLLSRWRAK
jgi:hypothetical protein